MEKQQKIKLWVAIGFVAVFTLISIFAYVKILKPIRDGRSQRTGKYTLKTGYKTKYNPDFIDSVSEVSSKKNRK